MTIFVGGVHAVGKTFVLKMVCKDLGFRHAMASQLIKEQRGLTNWAISRQVDDINENQRLLVAAMKQLGDCEGRLVLDGHFVLRRAINSHVEIDVETFAQLKIRGVVLLEAASATIAERLARRGDTTWQKSEIEAFAQKELEHAQSVCRELKLPLVRAHSASEVEFRTKLVGLWDSTRSTGCASP
ncbi:conserved hypothetical protein [Cupriavidus taiwanensis]|uniref:ATP-binding protein n=1 Tax=Cupriavidus taiwanensis TaxID=164546 RepID=UPI000E125337|nr:ATP-binding protein [Cupriavidus taiwanensis]SOZ22490.1 conserved hypothetical protein [Cupriavidus taiwanensis]SOZ34507.1 conserved hypothetical protein [Cupriavidus taiwanensis]SOZ53146.1 conserved hypothetical protein [Cupriavidus taiwanensis]